MQPGDFVVCKVNGERSVQRLTDVIVWVCEDAEREVFEITFRPDDPVAVLQEPSGCLLSKGFKQKPTRRGLACNARQRRDAVCVADAARGEYSE